MCNNYYFATVMTVARTRLDVTLYVRCLSCIQQICYQAFADAASETVLDLKQCVSRNLEH